MDYQKEAEKPHHFEYFLFVLLGILLIILFVQIFNPTGLTITGNVVENEESGQAANIGFVIEITDAEHFSKDSVKNIYNEVSVLDDVWSETIEGGDFVRVVFEQNLTNERDITTYLRIVSGNPKIQVYEKDSEQVIALFDNLVDESYNKVYLTSLQGTQDTFDLKVIGGSLQFDYIFDPVEELNITTCTAASCNVANYNQNTTSVGSALAKNAADNVNISATVNLETIDTINSVSLHFRWTNRVNLDGNWQITPQSQDGLTNYCAAKSIAQTDLAQDVYSVTDIYTGCVDTKAELDNLRLNIINADAGGGVTGDVLYVDIIIDYIDVVDNPPKWFNPSVNDSTPDPNQLISHNINWTEDFGLSYATLEINSTGASCDTAANVSSTTLSGTSQWANLSWQVPNGCEGKTIGWKQYANDSFNNWNATDLQTYNVNNVNPIATAIFPIDNEWINIGSDLFWVEGSDNLGISYLRIYSNFTGIWAINQTNTTPINDTYWTVSVEGIPEGQNYKWAVWVNDSVGNEDFTDTNRTLTVDLTNPVATINAPPINAYTNDNTPDINITATDNFASVINYEIQISFVTNKTGVLTNNTATNVTLDPQPDGFKIIRLLVEDNASRTNTTTTINLIIDTIIPQIVFATPTENNATSKNQDWIFANVSITDTSEKNITFQLFNSTGLVNNTEYNLTSNSSVEVNWTGLLNENVQYWYNVSVYDRANNYNETETRYLTLISNQAPEVTIIYPQNTTYNVDVTQLNYTATDDAAVAFCWYSLDGGVINSTPTSSCTNFTSLTSNQGSNTWTVYANDSFGLEGSDSVTFFKDTIFPQFTNYQRNPTTPNEDQSVQVNVTVTETNKDTVILEWNNGTNVVNRTITTTNGDEFYFTITTGNYTAHDSITYYWYANDTVGNTNRSAQQSFTVANQVPIVSAPAINDTTPETNDLISCNGGTFSDSDAEDTEQERFFRWYDNDVLISGQTSQTLSLAVSGLNKGDIIKCEIRVYDGFDNSSFVNSSNTATIQNSPPVITNSLTTVSWNANGTIFIYDYEASDVDGDTIIWYDNTTLFDINSTGYVSDTPTEAEDGSYEIRISASDGTVNGTDDFTYTINDVTFPLISFTTGTENNGTTFARNWIFANVTITETNRDTITFSLYNSTSLVNQTHYTAEVKTINWTSLPNDVYRYNVSVNDTSNNANATETRYIILDTQGPSVSGLTESPSDPATYSPSTIYRFNATITDPSLDDVLFEFEGVNYTATLYSGNIYNATITNLAVGTYNYRWYANDTFGNINGSLSGTYTVNQNPEIVYVLFNETSPITYPATFRVYSNATSAFTLYRNGTVVSNNSEQVLTAGTWNFTAVRTDKVNYSNIVGTAIFTINKASPSLLLSISPSISVTYGTETTVTGSGCSGQITCTLYRNGVAVSNPDVATLGVAVYNYTYNTTGGDNYTGSSTSQNLTINKATGAVYTYLDNARANKTIEQFTLIYLNGTLVNGTGNIKLYNNGTLINQGTSPLSNLTNFTIIGLYNITTIYDGNSNYTSAFETWWVNVSEADVVPPQISIIYPTNISYNAVQTQLNYSASDNFELDECWYSTNNGQTNTTITCGQNVSGLNSGQGSSSWIIYANDTKGLQNSSSVTFFADSINPPIEYVSPSESNNSQLTRNYIQVNVTASDTNLDNIVIRLYNSTGSLIRQNISSTSPFFINYTGLTAGTYYFNATANDTLNNQNSTATRNVSLVVPTINITLPENKTYLTNTNLPLNFTAINADFIWYNIDGTGQNITITSNTTFNTSGADQQYILYLYANNSVGEAVDSITFAVNTTKFRIYYDNYQNQGASTDFNQTPYENVQNVSGVILEDTNYGRVVFSQSINLTADENSADNELDLDSNTNISDNFVDINTTALPNFNKSATISLYGLTFSNPRVLKDGELCSSSICTEVSYSGGTFVFSVTGFTNYSAEETPGSIAPAGSSGGGGGAVECTENNECLEDEVCLTGQCVKLFDIKIIEFKSPVKLGEFFEFIYFVKGMANINGDVTLDFWIENSDREKITTGSDVIYLGEFEERTESTKIFLPRNVESGVYQFYVQVSYGAYTVSSHRTIELDVANGVATLGPGEEPKISIPLIVVIILLLFLISAGRMQRHSRKRSEISNLIKTFEVKVGDTGEGILHKIQDIHLPHIEKQHQIVKKKEIKSTRELTEPDKQSIISKIKKQANIEPLYKSNFKYHEENEEAKQEEKLEKPIKEEYVSLPLEKPQKPEEELIDDVVEETKKKNSERKTAEEILDELKDKDKKEQTDDGYYESLFKP